MKTTIIVAVILLFAGVVQAQSAPTVQQCRADASTWKPHGRTDIENGPVPYTELLSRAAELRACGMTYPDDTQNPNFKWVMLASVYDHAAHVRLAEFISRHNLGEKFIAEDEAGKR
jgi:hypothetical protein